VAPPEQELDGLVWLDLDRDGRPSPGEPGLPEMAVTLAMTELAPEEDVLRASALRPATPPVKPAAQHRTDGRGDLRIPSVPAGVYAVSVRVPAMLFVTGDSDGELDATARVKVPEGGSGRFWVGLVGDAGVSAIVRDPLGKPRTGPAVLRWFGPDGEPRTQDDVLLRTTVRDGALDVGGLPAGSWEVSLGVGEQSPVPLELVATETTDVVLDARAAVASPPRSRRLLWQCPPGRARRARPPPLASARALRAPAPRPARSPPRRLGLVVLGGLLLQLGRRPLTG
jgi:hypothetical protein